MDEGTVAWLRGGLPQLADATWEAMVQHVLGKAQALTDAFTAKKMSALWDRMQQQRGRSDMTIQEAWTELKPEHFEERMHAQTITSTIEYGPWGWEPREAGGTGGAYGPGYPGLGLVRRFLFGGCATGCNGRPFASLDRLGVALLGRTGKLFCRIDAIR